MSLNYYHILEVGYNASQDDVKQAYRKLAKMYHPDVNADDTEKAEMFKLISEAYKVLSDADRKAAYDLRLLLGIHEEYRVTSGDNAYTYDARSRTFRPQYRSYYRRREPISYSRKTYMAVTLLLVFVAAAILLVPLSLSRYSSSYNYDKGLDYYSNGQYYAALNSFDRAILDFGSKNVEACLLAGNILIHEFGQYTFAMEYVDKGLKMAPTKREKAQLLYMKGLCQQASADYYTALKQFEAAQTLWPEYDSLYYAMAEIHAFHLDDYAKALESYNKLITINPGFSEAYYGRAYSFLELNEVDKAWADIEHYMAFNDQDGRAQLLKGELELRGGNTEEACACFKRASLMRTREAKKMVLKYCK